MLTPAVHGTELWVLVVLEAIVAPITLACAIAYVRTALANGRSQAHDTEETK